MWSLWPKNSPNIFQTLLSQSSCMLLLFGSFHFSFFGQSDQKRKNQLTCLFIFCIKSSHFAWKWQLIFSFFGHFDQKPKTEKWNELNIRLTVITNSLFSLKTIEQMTHKYNAYNKSRKYVSQYQIKISQAIFGTKWGFTYLKAYLVSTPPVGMFCWYCYKELVVDSGSTHS